MRTAVTVLVWIMVMTACVNKTEEQARKSGKEIFFEEKVYDYGEIAVDSDGECGFLFRNISDKPIVINRVRSNCGCTIPGWPEEPIEPGESDTIKAIYNTSLTGPFTKTVYVYSTAANSPVKLQIKGKVIDEPKI